MENKEPVAVIIEGRPVELEEGDKIYINYNHGYLDIVKRDGREYKVDVPVVTVDPRRFC